MPPPPPPPPPGAPPPPKFSGPPPSSKGGKAPERGALLGQIHSGIKLKKAVTNDRSGLNIGNKKPSPMGMGDGPGKFNTVASRPTSGTHGAIPFGRGSRDDYNDSNHIIKPRRKSGRDRPSIPAPPRPTNAAPAPGPPVGGLGGLFAGGIPRLPNRGGRTTGGSPRAPGGTPMRLPGATRPGQNGNSVINGPGRGSGGPPPPPPNQNKPQHTNIDSGGFNPVANIANNLNHSSERNSQTNFRRPSTGSIHRNTGAANGVPKPQPPPTPSRGPAPSSGGASHGAFNSQIQNSNRPPPPSSRPPSMVGRPLPAPPSPGLAKSNLPPPPPAAAAPPPPPSTNKYGPPPIPPSSNKPPQSRNAAPPPPPSSNPPPPPSSNPPPPPSSRPPSRGNMAPPPPLHPPGRPGPPPPPQRTTPVGSGGTIGRAGRTGPPPPTRGPSNHAPPPPERRSSSHYSGGKDDFETRFHFHALHDFPPPEPMGQKQKTYPSKNAKNPPERRAPPPPPPPK